MSQTLFYIDEDEDYWYGNPEIGVLCIGKVPQNVANAVKNGENWVLDDLTLDIIDFDTANELHRLARVHTTLDD